MINECAISPLYDEDDGYNIVEDPLCYHKSCKLPTVGRDISYCELTSGDYFMVHGRSLLGATSSFWENDFTRLFGEDASLGKFVGYIPQYKGM